MAPGCIQIAFSIVLGLTGLWVAYWLYRRRSTRRNSRCHSGLPQEPSQATCGVQERGAVDSRAASPQPLGSRAAVGGTDPLSGLPDRHAFDVGAAQAIVQFRRNNCPLSLIVFDVDHFTRLNNVYGRAVGNSVLQGIAQVLRGNFRVEDLVARYGGDRFAVMLRQTTARQAMRGAEAVRQALDNYCLMWGGQLLRVTMSAGIASQVNATSAAQLAQRACEAMSAAKQAGRNAVFWHDGLRIQHSSRGTADELPLDGLGDDCAARSSPTAPDALAMWARTEDQLACRQLGTETMFRQQLRRQLDEWRSSGVIFSLLLGNVDGVEDLIHLYGDAIAEQAFYAVSALACANLRSSDQVYQLAKYTGGLLLPRTALPNAVRVSLRLRDAIGGASVEVAGTTLDITISVGVVEVAAGDESGVLLQRAHYQLERAMVSGGGRVSFAEPSFAASKYPRG